MSYVTVPLEKPRCCHGVGTINNPLLFMFHREDNTENSTQIFSEKELPGLSPNFHIYVSVSELYITTMGLPVLLEEICRLILGIYKSL